MDEPGKYDTHDRGFQFRAQTVSRRERCVSLPRRQRCGRWERARFCALAQSAPGGWRKGGSLDAGCTGPGQAPGQVTPQDSGQYSQVARRGRGGHQRRTGRCRPGQAAWGGCRCARCLAGLSGAWPRRTGGDRLGVHSENAKQWWLRVCERLGNPRYPVRGG